MKQSSQLAQGRSADLSDAEIEDLKRGAWQVDCPRMELRQRGIAEPRVFSGPGHISQDENAQLVYKIYAPPINEDWNYWNEVFGEQGGGIIPEKGFFDLSAVDYKGRRWNAEHIIPDEFYRVATTDYVVVGDVTKMWCDGDIPKAVHITGSNLRFHVFQKLKIPGNTRTSQHKHIAGWSHSHYQGRDAWSFRAAGYKFLVTKVEQGHVEIRTLTKQYEWPTHIEKRILASLFFVLGVPIYPTVTLRRIGHDTRCTLHSGRRPLTGVRHQPPLPLRRWTSPKTDKATAEPYRKLFEKFFAHSLKANEEHHLLWAQLNAVYEASAGTFIDSQALTLAVAIESILESEFPDLGKPSKADLEKIKSVIAHLKTWDGDKELLNRAVSSLSGMKASRAGDKMRALAKEGAITTESAKAWTRLRNVNAHSFQTGSLASEDFHDIFQTVQTLFYQIIFRAIGYRGLYHDRASTEKPFKHYPPAKAERATGNELDQN